MDTEEYAMLSRRSFLQTLGLGLGGLAATQAGGSVPARRPNIVLFLVDDMGWQDTSLPFLYHDDQPVVTRLNRRYDTPAMEALARDGMLFTDAYAHAICSPSRCSLMSGMNAARHRVTCWTLRVDQPDRLDSRGEGLRSPRWSVNGLQPPGTLPAGACQPPWRTDARRKFVQPPLQAEAGRVPYRLSHPYTCAKTLPALLREAGYCTIHCGKAHWGSGSQNYGLLHDNAPVTPGADPRAFGFDVNIAGCENGAPRNYRGDRHYGNLGGYKRFAVPGLDENNHYENNDFLTDALTAESLRAVERHVRGQPNQPFFLYLAHYALHSPLDNNAAWDASRSDSPRLADDTRNPDPNDGLPWNEAERNYATLVKGMDDSLAALRAKLEILGVAQDTLILFMADNGGLAVAGRFPDANEPLRAGKGSCYEGGVREPMIACWPGKIASGAICQEPILIEDFFPTILEVAGIPSAKGLAETPAGIHDDGILRQTVDGESFLPVLLGKRSTIRADGAPRPLLWHYPHCWGAEFPESEYHFFSALRLGDWKLIYQHGTRAFELYDLRHDLGETCDLAKEYPDVVLRLRREMGRLLRERRAQMPLSLDSGEPVPWPDAF